MQEKYKMISGCLGLGRRLRMGVIATEYEVSFFLPFFKMDFIFQITFRVTAKLGRSMVFLHLSLPHKLIASLQPLLLTFVTIYESTLTICYHPKSIVYSLPWCFIFYWF